MTQTTRREFVKHGAFGACAIATSGIARAVSAKAETKAIRLGVIGCGFRGQMMAECFAKKERVEIVYLCDVNSERLAKTAAQFNISSKGAVNDMRRVFDDPQVDAVLIATPDHWHAPAGILACEAGKHAYIEKPCSHNVREGRLLVEAARRTNRVVQLGTQVRSTPMIIEAVKLLHDGIIGDVIVAKVWNVQLRQNIGHMQPSTPPDYLDYDLWVGPAPLVRYQQNHFMNWHWMYHFGTGDMGNDGIHDVDYGRWGLGATGHPSNVVALGGKFFFDDDQEFPDTQQVTFEYGRGNSKEKSKLLIYEQRLWSTNYPSVYNVDAGVEYYGTQGRMFLSRRGKIQVLGPDNKRRDVAITTMPHDHELHIDNFLDCVRTGSTPNGEIEQGHITTTLCHLGNIATRFGRSLTFDGATETIVGDDDANKMLSREYREHWAALTV